MKEIKWESYTMPNLISFVKLSTYTMTNFMQNFLQMISEGGLTFATPFFLFDPFCFVFNSLANFNLYSGTCICNNWCLAHVSNSKQACYCKWCFREPVPEGSYYDSSYFHIKPLWSNWRMVFHTLFRERSLLMKLNKIWREL